MFISAFTLLPYYLSHGTSAHEFLSEIVPYRLVVFMPTLLNCVLPQRRYTPSKIIATLFFRRVFSCVPLSLDCYIFFSSIFAYCTLESYYFPYRCLYKYTTFS